MPFSSMENLFGYLLSTKNFPSFVIRAVGFFMGSLSARVVVVSD
jgi:hypothetical protein